MVSKIKYNHGKIVKIYIVYEIINDYSNDTIWKCTNENALVRAVTLTKNTDIDKYKYAGYGIEFDGKIFTSW